VCWFHFGLEEGICCYVFHAMRSLKFNHTTHKHTRTHAYTYTHTYIYTHNTHTHIQVALLFDVRIHARKSLTAPLPIDVRPLEQKGVSPRKISDLCMCVCILVCVCVCVCVKVPVCDVYVRILYVWVWVGAVQCWRNDIIYTHSHAYHSHTSHTYN